MGSVGEACKKLGLQLGNGWISLKPMQRLLFIAAGSIVFGALILLAIRTSRPEYLPLYANLREVDAAAVVQALREAGTPYRLAENGTAVLVPKSVVYQTRLDMAAKGLPESGIVGFEVFQQFSFGSTDFERNIKYTWALQGELTRTIRSIKEVEDARVHIALPEKSLFLREQRSATASVLLQLRPGARLTSAQVNGIAYLVAHSVESMNPEDVTIIDGQGNVLSKPANAEVTLGDATMQRLDIQRTFERDVEQHLQSMLETVWGEGRALVRVKADMNFDSEDETIEIYEQAAPGGLVRSSKTQEESSDSSSVPGGVAGVTSSVSGSLPSYAIPENVDGNNRYQRRSAEVNYEVNHTARRRVVAPGRVMGLSVAVWIDGELSSTEKEQVRASVLAAVSGSAQRADTITVESMPFRAREEHDELQGDRQTVGAESRPWFASTMLLWMSLGALLAAFLAGCWLIWRRRGAASHVDITLPEVAATTEPEPELAPPTPNEVARQRKAIERFAKERPSDFANLVRVWLDEE